MSIFTGAGVALVTPMKENLEVNYDKLDEILEWQIAEGTDAIIICGTTGESATLSEEEHANVIRFAIERVITVFRSLPAPVLIARQQQYSLAKKLLRQEQRVCLL